MSRAERTQALVALAASTVAFTVCFACWVLNAILVTFLAQSGAQRFDEGQVGWLLAAPILTGALVRLPLGVLTDRYGGRPVFAVLMLVAAVPLYLVSAATGYHGLLLASLGFGLVGGSFAVGVGYVSAWFPAERQGTALGIFGMGNAGAALTTLVAPGLLGWFTDGGGEPEGWRLLPRVYALALALTAVAFVAVTRSRRAAAGPTPSVAEQLAPLRSLVVWRLGLYYALVFGAFVALAQWIVPYTVSVYHLPIAQAGLIASLFSLPSGVIRAAGGWLSDRFGARSVMYGVFGVSVLTTLLLSVPRMDVRSPGEGVLARRAGTVTAVSTTGIAVGVDVYPLVPPPPTTDGRDTVWPRVTSWQEPAVAVGDRVPERSLLARGVTHVQHSAHLGVFTALVLVFGVATGIGKAGVYKLIPEQFPGAVGVVGGTVGLIGGLGGFLFPLVWSRLLGLTGLWASCWMLLAAVSGVCLVWLHVVVRRIMREEAPDLVQLIERRPGPRPARPRPAAGGGEQVPVEALLRKVPFFTDLPAAQMAQVARIARPVTAEAGSVVMREGEPGTSLYVILAGQARVSRAGPEGEPVELATLGAGDFVGELALIDGKPRSATVAALAPCEFLVIERHDFLTVLARATPLLAGFLVGLSERVRRSSERSMELAVRQERVRAQQEIERHRLIAEMVAGVAHEVNTPLGIINTAASVIAEQLTPAAVARIAAEPDAREALADVAEASRLILANAARADSLIKNFKNLSARQVTGRRETLDLRALTGEVLDLYRVKARRAGLAVDVVDRLGGADATWTGHPGCYSQILLNLVTNVERHAYPPGAGGRVEIAIGVDPAKAGAGGPPFTVAVRDFGRGIPPGDLDRVFEPFFTTGRESGGTGLGLAIVQNLATEALGGTVRVESAPGQGTTVTLTFPRVAPGDADAAG